MARWVLQLDCNIIFFTLSPDAQRERLYLFFTLSPGAQRQRNFGFFGRICAFLNGFERGLDQRMRLLLADVLLLMQCVCRAACQHERARSVLARVYSRLVAGIEARWSGAVCRRADWSRAGLQV